jgi:hypothetical protein
VPDHRLKLERNVFDDVRRVRAIAKPQDEAASFTDAATVLDHSWHRLHKRFSKAGNVR